MPLVILSCFISWVPVARASENEGVELKLGKEWKRAFSAQTRQATILEFIREGDDINHWEELVTIQNVGSRKSSPEKLLDKLKALRETECPGATEWNVIQKDENSILYEWHANPCAGWPEQVEIARIMSGQRNSFFLHYAAKVHELTAETRALWIKTFLEATLDSEASALVPSAGRDDVDEVVPFPMEKVMTALKPAMESQNCNVTESTTDRIECKRPRVFANNRQTSGGESVTAVLGAKGDQTQVRITTGLGFYGRLAKSNWSTPIYEQMVQRLQESTLTPPTTADMSEAAGAPAGSAQDNTPVVYANWGYNPAPGARLELKEAGRKPGRHGTVITYHAEGSGFPTEKTYSLWMMQSGDHKTLRLLTGYQANAAGLLICPGQTQPGDPPQPHSHCFPLERASIDVDNYHNGEPVNIAIISTDGAVRAYARAYPFPIQAQDGKCTLNVEIANSKFSSFIIRGVGFEPNENIKTSSSFGDSATPGTQQASPTGEFAVTVQANSSGQNSGSSTFTATGDSCHPIVTYELGKAAKKIQ